jgi:Zn-dependent protease with chaperone function
MRTFARALQLIALLLGFYLLCILLIVGLIVLDVLAFHAASSTPALDRYVLFLVAATVGAIVIVIRGVFVSTRVKEKDLPGVVLPEHAEPLLWRRVRDLAAAVGTRPPAEIRLVPDVNAAVMEHAHLSGLIPGKRRMLIGAPLLLALSMPQFDAVIGHELGHYSGKDSRLGPLTGRTRQSVIAALKAVHGREEDATKTRWRWPGHALFAALFTAYAKLVFTTTFATSRQQEFAADRFSASIAGRENAAAALRELPVIDTAYGFYLDRYVAAALPLGLAPQPAEILGGFGGMLADPDRLAQFHELRTNPRDEKAHKFDSHPPMVERIAAILALPADGRPVDQTGVRAIVLLAQPAVALGAVGIEMLGKHAAGKAPRDWDTIAGAVGIAAAREASLPLVDVVRNMIGRPPRVVDLLDLVDAGRFEEILESIPRSEAATKVKATGRAAREFAKTQVTSMLGAWTTIEVVQSGRASILHSWSKSAGDLVTAPGLSEALDKGIDALVAADANTMPLRAALTGSGIPA